MADRCPKNRRPGCGLRHCRVCNTWHLEPGELQTCVQCVGQAARNLRTVYDLDAMLPAQAIHGQNPEPHAELKVPGGDALVMMVDGSGQVHGLRARFGYDPGPAAYSYPSDPSPQVAVLGTWEDDWRHIQGQPPGPPATMTNVVRYLLTNLPWAAQHHTAFDEFAAELWGILGSLDAVLFAGARDERGEPCTLCEDPPRLVQTYDDPHPPTQDGDQGGRRDTWTCPRCHATYTPAEYLKATEQRMWEDQAS